MGTLKFVFRYMPYASPESIVDLEGDMLSWMSQIKNFREIFLSKTPAATNEWQRFQIDIFLQYV